MSEVRVNLAALGSMNNYGTGGVGGGFPGGNLPEGAGGEIPEMPDGADATGRFGGQMPEGELPEGELPKQKIVWGAVPRNDSPNKRRITTIHILCLAQNVN